MYSVSKSSTALIVALGISMISGCATTSQDAYTGETKTSNTAKGAMIGSVVGAVGGALTGERGDGRRTKRALIGAALGAAAGGGIGHYMDKQEAELRQQLRGTGVSVTRRGDNIILNMPGNITFSTDSANINSTFYPVLNSVAVVLRKFNETRVEVGGHTDSRGTELHNQKLSQRRAESVTSYLAGQGIPSSRVYSIGYGESRPIADNMYAPGRAKNRRVEVQILPMTRRS